MNVSEPMEITKKSNNLLVKLYLNPTCSLNSVNVVNISASARVRRDVSNINIGIVENVHKVHRFTESAATESKGRCRFVTA